MIGFFLFFSSVSWAKNPPSLSDYWENKAYFGKEERINFQGVNYNSVLDFYYETHDKGMAVIEDPKNSNVVYYLASWNYVEPHMYKSIDGGKTFKHLGKLINVIDRDSTTACSSGSNYSYWDYQGKKWCHFQLREPDIMFYQDDYWVIFEAVAKSFPDGEKLMGPAVFKLSSLDINQPITIKHGTNMRQHPLLQTYDGDPQKDALQETSISTPFWYENDQKISVFWVGVHPINSTWERVDTYKGHFTDTPQASHFNCSDPMWCYFSVDEGLITNPNFAINPKINWESKNVDGMSVVSEDGYNYLFYSGCDHPKPELGTESGLNIVRSKELKNWQRKFINPQDLILYQNTEENPQTDKPGHYGKLVKLNDGYYIYYFRRGQPSNPNTGNLIARVFRRKLVWDCPTCLSEVGKDKGDSDCNNKIDLLDFAWWLNAFKSGTNDREANFNCQIDGNQQVNLTDFNVWFNNFISSF
jgi:hypothetical protein